ncbi:TPA: PLP-dependent aminotransferase family protein, partial [Pseudomonas aeruginosa]|nr:PLP-dependent aminotransferase family protein [Pseudomonas aeruginosa]
PLPAVEAGLHLCVRVDSLARERTLIAAAAAAGVEVSALSDYWMDDSSVAPDDRAGLVLGFAAVPEARIDEALRALRKAWRREALVGPVVATD